MTGKIRILFLSANPWTTSRIRVDEEAREIFERIQEGPYRNNFELHNHAATRPIDLQRLLLMRQPHVVHFSGHGSKKHKIILGGNPGRGKAIDTLGLAEVLALYNSHVRLVLLNACFTTTQARALSEVIDYSVGAGKGIGDKGGVAFAGAFYRALGFGRSIKAAFESAKAELGLTRIPRTQGFELFIRDGIGENDSFPQSELGFHKQQGNLPGLPSLQKLVGGSNNPLLPHSETDASVVWQSIEERSESEVKVFQTSITSRSRKWIRSEVILQSNVKRKAGTQA